MERIKTGNVELRKVFSDTLLDLMNTDENVVYLEADLSGAIGTTKLMAQKPEQSVNIGIMEANMIGVAAGMSVKGKIPFVHSFGTFTSRRCADQIFLSGCYNRANVNIIGSDPGVAAESNGGTHMPLEDVAVLHAFPELQIFDVAEPSLLRFVLTEAAKNYGMTYTRFPRKGKRGYYDENQTFEIGKGIVLREGKDVTIIASGLAVFEALEAAKTLAEAGIDAEVIDMFTIKPIDAELVCKSAAKTGAIVTAENHNIIGGLGSAVAEVLVENCPVPMKRIGSRDHFGEVGDQKYLMNKFGMTSKYIVRAAEEVLARKNKG
jgi:transketolase